MISRDHWSTGITLRYEDTTGGREWSATLDFRNDSLLDGIETEQKVATGGQLRTLSAVPRAVDAATELHQQAQRMGIALGDTPMLYLHADNWPTSDNEFGSPAVEEVLIEVCVALGWDAARQRRAELHRAVHGAR